MKARTKVLLALLWVLVVLYPNPLMLVATLERTVNPEVDSEAVREIAATLPSDPTKIRELVLNRLVPYEQDWNIYGVPWYFPSTKEVVRDGRGDCESQAVMLASILTAKGIPHQIKMSFDHMWVDFAKKQADDHENDAVAFARIDADSIQVKLPEKFDLNHYIDIQMDARWHPMPPERKTLIFAGLLVILLGQTAWTTLSSLIRSRAHERRPEVGSHPHPLAE